MVHVSPGTRLVCAGAGEQAAAEHRTGWLVNRDAMLLLVKQPSSGHPTATGRPAVVRPSGRR